MKLSVEYQLMPNGAWHQGEIVKSKEEADKLSKKLVVSKKAVHVKITPVSEPVSTSANRAGTTNKKKDKANN